MPSAENPKEQVLFRKLLINRCQEEFEKDRANDKDILRREKEIAEASVSCYLNSPYQLSPVRRLLSFTKIASNTLNIKLMSNFVKCVALPH